MSKREVSTFIENSKQKFKITDEINVNSEVATCNSKPCRKAVVFPLFFGFYQEIPLKPKPECFKKCLEVF